MKINLQQSQRVAQILKQSRDPNAGVLLGRFGGVYSSSSVGGTFLKAIRLAKPLDYKSYADFIQFSKRFSPAGIMNLDLAVVQADQGQALTKVKFKQLQNYCDKITFNETRVGMHSFRSSIRDLKRSYDTAKGNWDAHRRNKIRFRDFKPGAQGLGIASLERSIKAQDASADIMLRGLKYFQKDAGSDTRLKENLQEKCLQIQDDIGEANRLRHCAVELLQSFYNDKPQQQSSVDLNRNYRTELQAS